MNPVEIGVYAYNAGVHELADLRAAIAIAMAESSGNPNAVGDVGLQTAKWGPSIGLWQIRSVKAESGKGTDRDATRLKDPAYNAKSMFSISHSGHNWGPWTTWPLKAAMFMPVAQPAAASVIAAKGVIGGVGQAASAAGDAVGAVVPDGLADIGSGVKATYSWVSNRNNWLRVGKVTIGVIILGGAVYALANPTGRILDSKAGKAALGVVGGKAKIAANVVKGS